MDEAVRNFREQVKKATERERIVINRPDLTSAAVLVPIVFRDGYPHLIVTKRTMTVATHKGEISFPGGVREPEDKDVVENALRETEEEIGLDPTFISVVGLLGDFATTTGFVVTPIAGIVASEAKFSVDPVEVAELIEVSIANLKDPRNHELVTVEHEGVCYRYHQYRVREHLIWGATAGIIHDFLVALGE